MALPNAFLPPSIASYLRLTGTGVGRNSRTGLSQSVFVKTLPEKWVLFGSSAKELLCEHELLSNLLGKQ